MVFQLVITFTGLFVTHNSWLHFIFHSYTLQCTQFMSLLAIAHCSVATSDNKHSPLLGFLTDLGNSHNLPTTKAHTIGFQWFTDSPTNFTQAGGHLMPISYETIREVSTQLTLYKYKSNQSK
jgi:hypothetical protein